MIKVSSTNDNKEGKSYIRVYRDDKLLFSQEVKKRNPLPYLKSLSRSKYFGLLESQLFKHGLTLTDIGLDRHQREQEIKK